MVTPPNPKSQRKEQIARLKVLEYRRRLKKKSADKLIVEHMKLMFKALLADAYYMLDGLYSKADYTKDIERIFKRLDTEGICFATKALPAYINAVLLRIDNRETSFTGWKINPVNRIPRFLGGITNLVFESTDQVIATLAFESLYTICVTFKKLRGSYDQKKLVEQYRSFVEVDTNLMVDFQPCDIAKTARALAKRFICKINIEHKSFLPRPGPGATNTPRRKCERFSPVTLFRQVDNVLPYVEWFYTHFSRVVEHASKYVELENQAQSFQTARFKYVPKTYEKARGICIEENEVQVLQQAFRNGLWYFISHDEHISQCLPLTDQSVNALLALESSSSELWATLDMSDASNRVARILVAYMLQDNDEFLQAIMALSTRVIVPPKLDGYKALPFECNMFAPMGSGLCFPIMSLVHLFLIQAIILRADPNCTSAIIDSVRVYGDDIVLPSQYAPIVLAQLPKFGMKMNSDKSYYSGRFRESCGMHAYNGTDVTPVYVKYIPVNDDLTVLQSLLKNEADYYSKGFYHTAEFLRKTLSRVYPRVNLGLYTAAEGCGFAGYFRRVSGPPRGKLRWNEDYQCEFMRLPRFITNVETAEITEEEAYLRWLWTNADNSRVVDDGTLATKIAWCWVPLSHTNASQVAEENFGHAPVYCVDGLRW